MSRTDAVLLATLSERVSRNGVMRLVGSMGPLRLTAVCLDGPPGEGSDWLLYLDRSSPKPTTRQRNGGQCVKAGPGPSGGDAGDEG